MRLRKLLPGFAFTMVLAVPAAAHCPLCTVGAAAAAGGAAWLGVSEAVIGIFIGAFAASIGFWISRVLKKKYVPMQRTALILFSYLTTVLPLIPIIGGEHPVFLSWLGDYGKTYMVNLFLIGSLLGALIIMVTPWMSRKMTELRNGKQVPYQGISLTFVLLIALAVAMQLGF